MEKPAIEKRAEALTGQHLGNGVALLTPAKTPHFVTALFGGKTLLSIDAEGQRKDIELKARPLGGLYDLGGGRIGVLEFGGDRLMTVQFEGSELKPGPSITACKTPRLLEQAPGAKMAWLLCRDPKNRLVRVDLVQNTAQTVSLSGSTPADLALDTAGRWLFVANLASYDIATLDTESLQSGARIPVTTEPYKLLAVPESDRMIVLHANNPLITVIDTKEKTALGTVDVGAAPTRAIASDDGQAVFLLSPGAGKLIWFDPMTQAVKATFEVQAGAADLAWVTTGEGTGKIVLASGKTGDIQVIEATDTGLVEVGKVASGSAAGRVYVGSGPSSVWVTGPQAGRVARYEIDGSATAGGVP